MQITANLASRAFVDIRPVVRRLKAALTTLGVLNLCVAAGAYEMVTSRTAANAEAHKLQQVIDSNSAELTRYKTLLHSSEYVAVAGRTAALNQLFDEKSFSWTLLMRNLEGTVPPDIQLSEIQPNRAKDGGITVRIHAVGPRSHVIEFLTNIEHLACFAHPHVVSENTQNDGHLNEAPQPLSDTTSEESSIEVGYDQSVAASELSAEAPAASSHANDAAALCRECAVHPEKLRPASGSGKGL